MEKIIETSSPNPTITYKGRTLKISLTIDKVRYGIPVDALFDVAVRDNPKRRFLFVSKVLGKHLPIRPLALRVIGALLARAWYETCSPDNIDADDVWKANTKTLVDTLVALQEPQLSRSAFDALKEAVDPILNEPLVLDEKTLFIGFAETATGIAQSVFSNFQNASYIHTTREQLAGMEPNFVFNEEHSHAMEHALYTMDKNFLDSFDRIVLIDDELTTGRTAVNLMKNLPGTRFGLISILDWRSGENRDMFNSVTELDIKVCALLEGSIVSIEEYDAPMEDTMVQLDTDGKGDAVSVCLLSQDSIDGCLRETGRFGINSSETADALVKAAAARLLELKTQGPCLCLGTEEFIHIPCMIANELGHDVWFHSTTRSPILSQEEDNYCIRNKVRFPSPFKHHVANHIYNIPYGFYKQVFLFTEKPLADSDRSMFTDLLKTFHIDNIIFVAWN